MTEEFTIYSDSEEKFSYITRMELTLLKLAIEQVLDTNFSSPVYIKGEKVIIEAERADFLRSYPATQKDEQSERELEADLVDTYLR